MIYVYAHDFKHYMCVYIYMYIRMDICECPAELAED